jgi:hypothetical protein
LTRYANDKSSIVNGAASIFSSPDGAHSATLARFEALQEEGFSRTGQPDKW